MNKYILIISASLACLPFLTVESQSGLKITPGELWPDTEGFHINAHGGGILKHKFIYMGDRWIPENLADSRHIWLPVEWEDGIPVIKWHQSWDLKQF